MTDYTEGQAFREVQCCVEQPTILIVVKRFIGVPQFVDALQRVVTTELQ
jgi:hypothetical protein